MSSSHSDQHHDSTSQAYDSEIRYGFLLKVFVGAVVGIALTCAFIYWLYFLILGLQKTQDPAPSVLMEASEPIQVPGPLLLAQPERELERDRRRTEEKLSSYGWIDEASGTAYIPIDVAIDKLVARSEPSAHSDSTAMDHADEGAEATSSEPSSETDSDSHETGTHG